MTTNVQVVLCSVPSEEVGAAIARALVEERLAACVNLLPQVRSIYRYEGKLEDDRELLLVIKSAVDRYVALEQRIRALHPYALCEVIALDVAQGSLPYLAWVVDETRHGEGR
jgi:periplasmic divalent cation tolerance protein